MAADVADGDFSEDFVPFLSGVAVDEFSVPSDDFSSSAIVGTYLLGVTSIERLAHLPHVATPPSSACSILHL